MRRRLVLLWRLSVATVLQVCWAARVLLTPAFGLFGSILSLVNAQSALDVVANSIAVGFM